MAKLAFLGLGLMGTPMATRLLDAGHDVTVWNRTPEKTRPLAERGASVASTPAQAVAGVDAAITMVTNEEALDQVVLGEDGLAAALAPSQLLIDMSTVGPGAVRSVAAQLPRGVIMVDAPVRGSIPEATAGRLAIYVGAADAAFEQARPILANAGHSAPRWRAGSRCSHKGGRQLDTRRGHRGVRRGSCCRRRTWAEPRSRDGRTRRFAYRKHCPRQAGQRRVGSLSAELQAEPGVEGPSSREPDSRARGRTSRCCCGVTRLARASCSRPARAISTTRP